MLGKLLGPSKHILIRQIGSRDNKLALQAVQTLKAKGWFRDGSLEGAPLERANLQGAVLAKANMEWAILRQADLTRAYLGETNLHGADLQEAILCDANMRNIILLEANLSKADLRRAYMPDAQLHRTNLSDANLQGVNFWQAACMAQICAALICAVPFSTKLALMSRPLYQMAHTGYLKQI